MKPRRLVVGIAVGASLLVGLVLWQGVGVVISTLGTAGWNALWLPAWFIAPLALAAGAWWVLFEHGDRPRYDRAFLASWIGLSVNWLLPVAQVGGELVKGRLIRRTRNGRGDVWPTVIVDKTLQVATQALYALTGLGLLAYYSGTSGTVNGFGVSIGILSLVVGLMLLVQRVGLFRITDRLMRQLTAAERHGEFIREASRLDESVREIYRCPRRVIRALCLRYGFRVACAFEVWLAARFLGYPISFLEAVIIESLAQTARMAAFLVPGGVGAQDGVVTIVGALVGLSGGAALGVALLKRSRELLVGIPGLAAWQFLEWRGGRPFNEIHPSPLAPTPSSARSPSPSNTSSNS